MNVRRSDLVSVVLKAVFSLAVLSFVSPVAPAKAAQPDCRKLVKGLASSNTPIRCRGEAEDMSIPPGYDWKAQVPIEENRKILFAQCEKALPMLAEGCLDTRYSLTSEWIEGSIYSWSVGQVCQMILANHIEVFRDCIGFSGPGEWHKYDFVPELETPIGGKVSDRKKKEIQDWWRGRKHKSLQELQIEAFNWAIEKRKEDYKQELGKETRLEMSGEITRLTIARNALKRSSRPLPPSEMRPSILSPQGYRTVPWTDKKTE
jgi:hypothetical protein